MVTAPNTPKPGRRPWISAARAAQILRKDPRTIRQMIRDRTLEGGQDTSGKRVSWFVYTDQPAFSPAPPDTASLADEHAQLLARAEAAEHSNRLLLNNEAHMLEALNAYQQGNLRLRQALEAQQKMIELYTEASANFNTSADSLIAVVGGLREIAAAESIPDDLRDLRTPPLQP